MKTRKEITYVLELSADEAVWLKSMVQTPIRCEYHEESEEDRKMRSQFWHALDDVDLP